MTTPNEKPGEGVTGPSKFISTGAAGRLVWGAPGEVRRAPTEEALDGKRKPRAAVPWACRYAFPRLRRANLIHEKNDEAWQDSGHKVALVPKIDGVAEVTQLVYPIVCDGFPSPPQVPPTGTPKPRCAPRRRGFTYDSVPKYSGNLDFVPCLFTLPLWLPGISSICLIQLSCGTRGIHALRS